MSIDFERLNCRSATPMSEDPGTVFLFEFLCSLKFCVAVRTRATSARVYKKHWLTTETGFMASPLLPKMGLRCNVRSCRFLCKSLTT